MNISYPSDAPDWLKKIVESIEESVGYAISSADTTEKLLTARGQMVLFRSFAENIDAEGKAQVLAQKKLSMEVTRRG